MRIFLDCIPFHEKVVRQVLRLASDLNMSQSPPAIAQQIHRFIRQLIGQNDPYHQIKERFNSFALELYPDLEERARESEDPFATAVRMAIAGNIIDFGINRR